MDTWVEGDARSQGESQVRAFETDGESVAVECECGQEDCARQLTVGTRMYWKVRRERSWHLLAVGHEIAANQRVVLRQSDFVVVDGS